MDQKKTYDEAAPQGRISEKDALTIRQAYLLYFRQLCFFAQNLTGERVVAEDIVADSFLKIYEKEMIFQTEGQLKAFLFTIVRNAAIDYLRSTERRKGVHEQILASSTTMQQASDLSMIRSEAISMIYAEIQKLPPQCREIIRLSFVEGKTIPEIAASMNLAYKTVQNQKARGLQLLRSSLINKDIRLGLIILNLLLSNTK